MKRYIKQITRDNFLYPNNERSYYDNEIIHPVNDGFPTGVLSGITINEYNDTTLDFTVQWEYFRNGCELFQNIDDTYTYITFHLLAPNQTYYKPWRYVGRFNDITPYTGTSIESDTQIVVTPSDLGLTGFTNGTYQLEARFIGKRAIYPVCATFETTLCNQITLDMWSEATSGDTCSSMIKIGEIMYSDTGDIENATVLFQADCGTLADEGWYKDTSDVVRYWSGTAFTQTATCP